MPETTFGIALELNGKNVSVSLMANNETLSGKVIDHLPNKYLILENRYGNEVRKTFIIPYTAIAYIKLV